MKKIYLAGGCFWGVEEFLSRINGVIDTEVGYANGTTPHPTYEDICTKNTGYTETVEVIYDENKISLKELLSEFWSIIDPTSLNRQGNDIGSQYRTGIYFINNSDLQIILESKCDIANKYTLPIVTEIQSLTNFYKAEEYHQDYLKKNPNGYCHIKF